MKQRLLAKTTHWFGVRRLSLIRLAQERVLSNLAEHQVKEKKQQETDDRSLETVNRYLGQPSYFTHPGLFRPSEVTPGITRTEFADRREKVMQNLSNTYPGKRLLLVLPAASVCYSAPDVPYPFRQDSDFLYMSGFQECGSLLLVYADPSTLQSHKSVLFVAKRDAHRELWEGPLAGVDGAVSLTGVDGALEHTDLQNYLQSLADSRELLLCCDLQQPITDVHKSVLEEFVHTNLNVHLTVEKPKYFIHQCRWTKSAAEIRLMRKACQVGSAALASAMAFTSSGLNENQLSAKFDFESRLRGACRVAYPPVVAGGHRANIIHYLHANQELREEEMLLMDAGCERHGYVSDITRSWPVSGNFTGAGRVLYEMLLHVHEQLELYVANVRPLRLNELHMEMVRLLGEQLEEHGVVSRDLDGEQLRRATDRLCPHHVSHYLGMDVHDTATVPRNIPVPPDVCITVEPGIYCSLKDTSVREEFRGIGIRIEDDILITDTGAENLTKSCPKTVFDIESVMRK